MSYFDSELTRAGTERVRIYIRANGKAKEAKHQAMRDITAYLQQEDSKVINVVPFKRTCPFAYGHDRECILQKQEILDALKQGYALDPEVFHPVKP